MEIWQLIVWIVGIILLLSIFHSGWASFKQQPIQSFTSEGKGFVGNTVTYIKAILSKDKASISTGESNGTNTNSTSPV